MNTIKLNERKLNTASRERAHRDRVANLKEQASFTRQSQGIQPPTKKEIPMYNAKVHEPWYFISEKIGNEKNKELEIIANPGIGNCYGF